MGLSELGGWPAALGPLGRGEDLSGSLAAGALTEIFEGNATPAQIAAFITLIHLKGETAEELTALVRTMLSFAETIPLTVDVIDTCGSGGSPQRSEACFNVSTLAALVVAAAGAKVAKHGGRSASATSSSADLFEALGVAIELGPEGVARCVHEVGIGFCFAPRFHPAARHAGPIRRELGVPTMFNVINPLSNPARPKGQVLGVSTPPLAERMARVLEANGATRAMVVYGHDGLDELTIADTSTIVELRDGQIAVHEVDPSALGLKMVARTEFLGGDPARNVELARRVLDGEPGAHRDIVVLNAAAGIVVAGLADDLAAGVPVAQEALDGGRAADVLDRLVTCSQAAASS